MEKGGTRGMAIPDAADDIPVGVQGGHGRWERDFLIPIARDVKDRGWPIKGNLR